MHALGVDVGGTKIAAGVVDGSGKILAGDKRPRGLGERSEPHPPDSCPKA